MLRNFTEKNVPPQVGKTAIVTGANTGIGFHTSRVLASRGARVLMGCRSASKAEAAIDKIRSNDPDADLTHLPLDLGDLGSVRAAAEIASKESKIDLLINNAGIMTPPLERTKDGFESQFGVNHLGPFAFTGRLLAKISQTPGARIVSTSSIAHKRGSIDFKDINADHSYDAFARYGMSKLSNLLFAYELDRRLRAHKAPAISVACHPGVADTELSRYFPKPLKLIAPLARHFFNTASMGAWPTLMAATAPQVEGGQYFGPSYRRETSGPAKLVNSTRLSRDESLAKRLWDVSIEMTGVDPGV